MMYTAEETVQNYLAPAMPVTAKITDQPLVIGVTGDVQFFSGAVESESVIVKSPSGGTLTRTSLALVSGANSVASAPLVPGSVVVASDSSLGKIYTENRDYVLDLANAHLYVKSGGELTVGITVVVWYRPYTVYAAGIDYALTAATGELRRISGGDIDPNETVYVDYAPLSATINEALVKAAVFEANGLIEKEVDPSGRFGADPVLQASATNAALAIICRSSAARALTGAGDNSAAVAWMKLAEQYAAVSERLLKAFRPPFENPSAPRIR